MEGSSPRVQLKGERGGKLHLGLDAETGEIQAASLTETYPRQQRSAQSSFAKRIVNWKA